MGEAHLTIPVTELVAEGSVDNELERMAQKLLVDMKEEQFNRRMKLQNAAFKRWERR